MTFDGNPLWLIGIIVAVVGLFWVLISASLKNNRYQDNDASLLDLDEFDDDDARR